MQHTPPISTVIGLVVQGKGERDRMTRLIFQMFSKNSDLIAHKKKKIMITKTVV